MDNQLALTKNTQNQQAQQQQTIILNVVDVEKKNQPRAAIGIAKSSSKGSLDVIRTSKKVQNRTNNYSFNEVTSNTHTEYIHSNPTAPNANEIKTKRSSGKSKKRQNGQGSGGFRNRDDIQQKGIEYARQSERKSMNGLAQQLSAKRIVEIQQIGPSYQQIRETQISAVTPQQPSSYNSANSRHKSNTSTSKPSLQTLQQVSGMVMVNNNKPTTKVRAQIDSVKTHNEKQLTYQQLHAAQQAEWIKQNQNVKMAQYPNIQKPQSIVQPNLNSATNYAQSSLFTPNIEHSTNELQKQRMQKRQEKSDHEINEIQANRLQKAGQSQVHYGSTSTMDPTQSQSALSKSQASVQKNSKRRHIQEQILTSQTAPLSQKLIKPQEGSQGSSSVRQELNQDILMQQKVGERAVNQNFPAQASEVRVSMNKSKFDIKKGEQALHKKKQQTVRSPSTNNLQDQIQGKNPTIQRSKVGAEGQQHVQINMPLLRKNRPQSNTGQQSIKNAKELGTKNLNSHTTSNQPSQAQLHVKYKQANLKQKQVRGGSLAQNPSMRTELQTENGTVIGSAHTTNKKVDDVPVYKNKAPKFVPPEKLKVRQDLNRKEAEKAEKEKQIDKRNTIANTTASNKMFLQIKGGKQNFRARNHILSSDSTSSDEFMYEDILDSPDAKNRTPTEIRDPKESVNVEQQSEKEISDHGDADIDWEAEEGEDEIDYAEYGEEQQNEELSNQGEEFNNNEEQSEHREMKQGGGPSNSEQEVGGQGPKTQTELEEEKKNSQIAGQKPSEQNVRRKKVPRLIMNLIYTFYPVIKKVAKQLNLRCKCEDIQLLPPPIGSDDYYRAVNGTYNPGNPPDFDIAWFDNPIPPEALAKIKPYQRISQFPGIAVISNKSKLARNLMKMQKQFPDEYDFFPKTFVLPVEYNEFKVQFEKHARAMKGTYNQGETNYRALQNQTYIIKPENMCQGKGIFLVRDPDDVKPNDHVVAQKYITNPLLVDDLKFDLRIYVLLYGVNPLRIFFFKDGLVRFATEPYQKPKEENIDNLFMHLTNYAINKNSDNFVQNNGTMEGGDEADDDGTHKRSLKSLWSTLRIMGYNVKKLKAEIKDIIVKTLITSQPSLCHLFRSCQPDDIENQLCFQILGFDVMLDANCKPWLIEVNQSPSFKTESGLDSRIKQKLVTDTILLLNLSWRRKNKIMNHLKQEMKKRMLTGKKTKLTPEEKAQKIKENEAFRNEFELANLGDFKLIYPSEEPEKQILYEKFLEVAAEHWEEFTTGKRRKNNQTSATWQGQDGDETMRDRQQLDSNGKPIWRASGVARNYIPAWERSFKKSMLAKQERLAQARFNMSNNYTPIPSSDKSPILSKAETQSPKFSGNNLSEQKPTFEDDSPLKFAEKYALDPQSKTLMDGKEDPRTPIQENQKTSTLTTPNQNMVLMQKRLAQQTKVLPTSQFQMSFQNPKDQRGFQPQGSLRTAKTNEHEGSKQTSTLIKTTELQAMQSKDSMTHLNVRSSFNAEQDGKTVHNRQFLSRQSMQQGRHSRTSIDRQLISSTDRKIERTELPGVEKKGPQMQTKQN